MSMGIFLSNNDYISISSTVSSHTTSISSISNNYNNHVNAIANNSANGHLSSAMFMQLFGDQANFSYSSGTLTITPTNNMGTAVKYNISGTTLNINTV